MNAIYSVYLSIFTTLYPHLHSHIASYIIFGLALVLLTLMALKRLRNTSKINPFSMAFYALLSLFFVGFTLWFFTIHFPSYKAFSEPVKAAKELSTKHIKK